jgi:23S rRNA (cytidine1920-2'-O)/16S rRNA (cytidine1409-2'-O)-methyltransferase
MPKTRLDLLLLSRDLAPSRSKAQALIMAGQVRVNGQLALKPATKVEDSSDIEIARGPRFVSRGGEKLQAAMDSFPLRVDGAVCADVGASTGGFTDCLLQHGASKVYAIDVGKGILDWKLRNDPRVVVMEGVNARYLDSLPEKVSLATIDASFISLKTLLPAVKKWLSPSGEIIALIKPQFEAGRREVSRGKGVIRDVEIHRRVILDILQFAQTINLAPLGIIRSPIRGPKGNVEFLARLAAGETPPPEETLHRWIDAAAPLPEGQQG